MGCTDGVPPLFKNVSDDRLTPHEQVVERLHDEIDRLERRLAESCCLGDPGTVCDACGDHACWAGRFMCDESAHAGTRPVQPEIVTICGSMRFYDHMLTVATEETMRGRIVLAPFCVVEQPEQGSKAKQQLDELHFRKIDMAEGIIVVTNQDGYVGESTRREMAYALKHGKRLDVREFQTDPVLVDGRRVIGAGHVTPG